MKKRELAQRLAAVERVMANMERRLAELEDENESVYVLSEPYRKMFEGTGNASTWDDCTICLDADDETVSEDGS